MFTIDDINNVDVTNKPTSNINVRQNIRKILFSSQVSTGKENRKCNDHYDPILTLVIELKLLP